MNADRDRDRLLDNALKHELGAAGAASVTDACLDAETMAAWLDGGLDLQTIAMAEAHASNCVRCQALLGNMARTTPATAVAEPRTARLWRWWFAPLAATAAAVTVWMVVPQPAPAPLSAPVRDEAFVQPKAVPVPPQSAATAPPGAGVAPARERVARQQDPGVANKAQAPTTLPPAPPLLETVTVTAESPVVAQPAAPAAGMMARSDAASTTRSSPSPNVIWTVGPTGLVQLATDGRTFVRLPFPEAVDLVAVTATDDRHAVVTTADGRTFQTADGGRTWTRP